MEKDNGRSRQTNEMEDGAGTRNEHCSLFDFLLPGRRRGRRRPESNYSESAGSKASASRAATQFVGTRLETTQTSIGKSTRSTSVFPRQFPRRPKTIARLFACFPPLPIVVPHLSDISKSKGLQGRFPMKQISEISLRRTTAPAAARRPLTRTPLERVTLVHGIPHSLSWFPWRITKIYLPQM